MEPFGTSVDESRQTAADPGSARARLICLESGCNYADPPQTSPLSSYVRFLRKVGIVFHTEEQARPCVRVTRQHPWANIGV